MDVQAQCILFKRCSEDLAPFKYAGYPMLLQAISLPEDDGSTDGTSQRPPVAHFLGDEIAPRLMVRLSGNCLVLHRIHEKDTRTWSMPATERYSTWWRAAKDPCCCCEVIHQTLDPYGQPTPPAQVAVELCWLTCVSSELNGEELTRAGGVATLGALLMRCASVAPPDVRPDAPVAVIATQCLRTFAGMAAFATARQELVDRSALERYRRSCVPSHGPALPAPGHCTPYFVARPWTFLCFGAVATQQAAVCTC